jgi:hypothetical protein
LKKLLLLFVILLLLGACQQASSLPIEPTLSNVPTAVDPEPINITPPTTQTPQTEPTITPEPIPTPEMFDPVNPFLFIYGAGSILLKDGLYTEISIEGIGLSWFTPEIWNGGDLLEQLGKCDRKAVITNTYDGKKLVTYKTVIYVHSGIAGCGQDNATNFIRVFLEGPYRNFPKLDQRSGKMMELTGKIIYLRQPVRQPTGMVPFEISEIKVIPAKDWFADCAEDDKICRGSMERFFTNPKPGVREEFLVFCSSEEIQGQRSKFILRLTPITDESIP